MTADRYDTIEDYMLLNAPRTAKEKPVFQTLCSLFVIAFAIAAMATDELSDGDIDLEFTSEDEDVDFDCGWNHVKFTFAEIDPVSQDGIEYGNINEVDDALSLNNNKYVHLNKYTKQFSYKKQHKQHKQMEEKRARSLLEHDEPPLMPTDDSTEILAYTSNELCDELDQFDADWCQDMQTAGLVWLICGIFSILSSFIAIAAVWKAKTKGSKLYLACSSLSVLFILVATLYWESESRCDEFEDMEGQDAHHVSMEVTVGASITLMYVALGFGIISILISTFYVFCKKDQRELNFDYNFDLQQRAGLMNDETQMAGAVGSGNNNNNNNNSNNFSAIVNQNDDLRNDENENAVVGNNVQVLQPKKGYEHVADEETEQ